MQVDSESRLNQKRAYSYVRSYLTRGSIQPPAACEFCQRKIEKVTGSKIFAWHPNPVFKREIIWLCKDCRQAIRVTRPLLILTWKWPGTSEEPIESKTVLPIPQEKKRSPRDRVLPEIKIDNTGIIRVTTKKARKSDKEVIRKFDEDNEVVDKINERVSLNLNSIQDK